MDHPRKGRRVIRIGCAERRLIVEADREAIAQRFGVRDRDIYTPSLFGAVQELVLDPDLRASFFKNLAKGVEASDADLFVVCGHEGCALIKDDLVQRDYMFQVAEMVKAYFGVEVAILWEICQGRDLGWDPEWLSGAEVTDA